MTQRSLPFQSHSLTSIEAAHKARESGSASRYREVVYAAISAAGSAGLTDEEISQVTRLAGNTARPRRIELLDMGRIIESGTRKTLSGRKAVVWMVK